MDGLGKLRAEIDQIDAEIVKALNKRFSISLEVGRIKAENGHSVLVSERENEIKEHLRRESFPEFQESILSVYAAILEESRSLQGKRG